MKIEKNSKNQHQKIKISSSFVFQFEAAKVTEKKVIPEKHAFGACPLTLPLIHNYSSTKGRMPEPFFPM